MRFSKATGMPDTNQLNWLGELELRNADSLSTSSFVLHAIVKIRASSYTLLDLHGELTFHLCRLE